MEIVSRVKDEILPAVKSEIVSRIGTVVVSKILDFVVGSVKNYTLDPGAEDELSHLEEDLVTLNAYLKTASVKSNKTEIFKVWERRVRGAVYDVEDTIETCILDKAAKKKLSKTVAEAIRSLREVRVKPLLEEAKDVFDKFSTADVPDTSASTREIRQRKREVNVVGFDDEAETIINGLKEESDSLAVTSIVGLPGLGKTTMAWKIFNDPNIKKDFPARIWVNVSEDFTLKDVLLTILRKLREETYDPSGDMTDVEQLKESVKSKLRKRKFLLVLDDVWTCPAWDQIKSSLVLNNEKGRVLITSRASYSATTNHTIHELSLLSANKSWELLQYEVYGKLNVEEDKGLKRDGKRIARKCAGLPLSIVIIGGILADKRLKAKGSFSSMRREWQEVKESLTTYLHVDTRLENIISLSFANMPYELKGCFLHLGVFPEDFEISAQKLTLMWMAEGFIPAIDGRKVEDVARDKLNDLINRNLVIIDSTKHNGDAKICRVHDTIREFCRRESASSKHNLYQEIDYGKDSEPPSESKWKSCRGLYIHSHVEKFLSEKPKVEKARSFLCLAKSPVNLRKEDLSCYTQVFRVIRVIDAENIKFPKWPSNLDKLLFLRYLTVAINNNDLKSLPPTIYHLVNLQTLILALTSPTIKMTDVWKLRQLRHLKTKASIIVDPMGGGDGGENLQTLSRLSPKSCTENVFKKAKNLTTLGIQGDLSNPESFKSLKELDHLNKLKLVHTSIDYGTPCPRLPEHNSFPPNLKILVLDSTRLSWEQMDILGKVNYLEMLKLKENAFIGESWVVTGSDFPCLEHLHIERADLEVWEAVDDAFPKLKTLYLKTCKKLVEVPESIVKKVDKGHMDIIKPELTSSVKRLLGKAEKDESDPGHHRAKRTKITTGAEDKSIIFRVQ